MGIFKINNVVMNLLVNSNVLKTQIITEYENNKTIVEFLDDKYFFKNKEGKSNHDDVFDSEISNSGIKIENYYDCLIEEDLLFPNCDEMHYDYNFFLKIKEEGLHNKLKSKRSNFLNKLDLNDDEILKDLLINDKKEIISSSFSEMYLKTHFQTEKHKKLLNLFKKNKNKFFFRKTSHQQIDDLLDTKYTYSLLDDLTKQKLYLFLKEDQTYNQLFINRIEIYDEILTTLKREFGNNGVMNINIIIFSLLDKITKYLEMELQEKFDPIF